MSRKNKVVPLIHSTTDVRNIETVDVDEEEIDLERFRTNYNSNDSIEQDSEERVFREACRKEYVQNIAKRENLRSSEGVRLT